MLRLSSLALISFHRMLISSKKGRIGVYFMFQVDGLIGKRMVHVKSHKLLDMSARNWNCTIH